MRMEPHLRRFFDEWPEARNLERAVRTDLNPNPLFFLQQSEHRSIRGAWLVLANLGEHIGSVFSISGEVLLLFTRFEDLQRRTFSALTEPAREEIEKKQRQAFNGEVRYVPDPTLAIMWTSDPRASAKLDDWNTQNPRSLVALGPNLASGPVDLLRELRQNVSKVLASQDLYRGRDPVAGDDFFGRESLLKQLTAGLRSGRSMALFGLRRSGKTSVLRELVRRAPAAGMLVILADVEGISELDELPRQISQDLLDALREERELREDLWIGDSTEHVVQTHAELASRLQRVAKRNKHLCFVLALDEIEGLEGLRNMDPEGVRHFLGAIRKAAQGSENLSILLTGITTKLLDESKLAPDLDNPIFGFAETSCLIPFAVEETRDLLTRLGERMMLHWETEAVEVAHESAGGFPLFIREFASAAREMALGKPAHEDGFFQVTAEIANALSESWGEAAADLWGGILTALESYHPVMADIAKASDAQLEQWLSMGAEAEAAAHALSRLGLLTQSGSTYVRSESLKALSRLSTPSVRSRDEVLSDVLAGDTARSLMRQPESEVLEFKSTARWNSHTSDADPALELAVLKTVAAFLNTSGGTLLIGVDDDGKMVGLAPDLKKFRGSLDRLQAWLLGSFLSEKVTGDLVAECIDCAIIPLDGDHVLRLDVAPSSRPVWVTHANATDAFFVRTGNSTRPLSAPEQHKYMRNHAEFAG